MPMTQSLLHVQPYNAPWSWRRYVAIAMVGVLHVILYYGFTHGMVIPKILTPEKPVILVTLPPETLPQPVQQATLSEQSPTDTALTGDAPILANEPSFAMEQQQAEGPVLPDGIGTEGIATGSGPVALPKLVIARRVDPQYPAAARRNGEEGTVLLSLRVDPSGMVSVVSVLRSSGSLRLDDAARDAVMRWRFVPHAGGTTEVHVPISFRIESVKF